MIFIPQQSLNNGVQATGRFNSQGLRAYSASRVQNSADAFAPAVEEVRLPGASQARVRTENR